MQNIFAGEMYSTICVEWALVILVLLDVNRATFDDEDVPEKRF